MKTLHTIKQQENFLSDNWEISAIEHRWSVSGYGSSRLIDKNGELLAKRSGCGYDRFGAVIGDLIMDLFPHEVYKLAKKYRNAKTAPRKNYQPSDKFYGLFFDAEKDRAWLDGACGYDCMIKVLNAIGYHLDHVTDLSGKASTGSTIYQLIPVPRHRLKWL